MSAAIDTGLANVTDCQPEPDSSVNVAWASRVPGRVPEADPTCVPVLPAALVEPDAGHRAGEARAELDAELDAGACRPSRRSPGVAKSKIVACGVAASEAAEAGLVPTAFVAVTRNV